MSSVNQYRIFCETENVYVYKWDTQTPTNCPNNNSHTINTSTITKISEISQNQVKIIEETPPSNELSTLDRFRCQGFFLSSEEQLNISHFCWPYPINALNIKFKTNIENIGDNIECSISPSMCIGSVDLPQTSGETTLTINSSEISNFAVNDKISILELETNYLHHLGKITNINGNIITFTNSLTQNIKKYQQIVKFVNLGPLTANCNIGDNTISVSSLIMPLLEYGMNLRIEDSVNTDDVQEIIKINNDDNTVNVSNNLEHNFTAGTALIYPSVKVLKNFNIYSETNFAIGDTKIGGSYIKKYYTICVYYKRPEAETYPLKQFHWTVDYSY